MNEIRPPSTLVERFVSGLHLLTPEFDRLGLAVSGGPDSLALLLLAHAGFPDRIAAATVDHGLRPENAAEARFVADLCAKMNVPHSIVPADVDRHAASLQQSARRARYAALAGWMQREGIGVLATAHHADDQAETLLMRLLRGAGVGGLAGVRARTPLPGDGNRQLIRPLLDWRRAELGALVERAGITPVDDPSNRDPQFDRTRIRMRLAATDWLDPEPLAHSASALADADEALNWAALDIYRTRVREQDSRLLFSHRSLPREFKRRMVRAILAALEPAASPRGAEMDRLLMRLEQGKTATLAGVKCNGGAEWCFERAPPRRKS
jgi:tRNA(Ile)-lysidine synthase